MGSACSPSCTGLRMIAGTNAGGEPPPEAGARHERTLEAVSCTPWLDGVYDMGFDVEHRSNDFVCGDIG